MVLKEKLAACGKPLKKIAIAEVSENSETNQSEVFGKDSFSQVTSMLCGDDYSDIVCLC